MGQFFGKLFEKLFGPDEARIAIIGLDAAGKSTILYMLKIGEVVNAMPTIGFNVETLEFKNVSLTAWDIGGQAKIRNLWRCYFENLNGLVFVVDSADKERMGTSKDNEDIEGTARYELHRALNDDHLKHTPLLVFANKQDQKTALPVNEIAQRLGLLQLKNRKWHIQGCSAIRREGLVEGLEWLVTVIKQQIKESS